MANLLFTRNDSQQLLVHPVPVCGMPLLGNSWTMTAAVVSQKHRKWWAVLLLLLALLNCQPWGQSSNMPSNAVQVAPSGRPGPCQYSRQVPYHWTWMTFCTDAGSDYWYCYYEIWALYSWWAMHKL